VVSWERWCENRNCCPSLSLATNKFHVTRECRYISSRSTCCRLAVHFVYMEINMQSMRTSTTLIQLICKLFPPNSTVAVILLDKLHSIRIFVNLELTEKSPRTRQGIRNYLQYLLYKYHLVDQHGTTLLHQVPSPNSDPLDHSGIS
jgi:hypothetical protein